LFFSNSVFDQKLNKRRCPYLNQEPENCENRNGPDMVQVFPKNWRVELDFTAPNLPFPLRLKGFI
jgi:hypothetical protein